MEYTHGNQEVWKVRSPLEVIQPVFLVMDARVLWARQGKVVDWIISH